MSHFSWLDGLLTNREFIFFSCVYYPEESVFQFWLSEVSSLPENYKGNLQPLEPAVPESSYIQVPI